MGGSRVALGEVPYKSERSHYAVEYSHTVAHVEGVSGHSSVKQKHKHPNGISPQCDYNKYNC